MKLSNNLLETLALREDWKSISSFRNGYERACPQYPNIIDPMHENLNKQYTDYLVAWETSLNNLTEDELETFNYIHNARMWSKHPVLIEEIK